MSQNLRLNSHCVCAYAKLLLRIMRFSGISTTTRNKKCKCQDISIVLKTLEIDPLGRPTVTAGCDNWFRTCCPSVRTTSVPTFQNLAKRNKFQAKNMYSLLAILWVWLSGSLMTLCFVQLNLESLIFSFRLCLLRSPVGPDSAAALRRHDGLVSHVHHLLHVLHDARARQVVHNLLLAHRRGAHCFDGGHRLVLV